MSTQQPGGGASPPTATGGTAGTGGPTAPVRSRLAGTLLRPRLRRVDVAVAALLALLGFAAVVQVRSTKDDGILASARQEDLVRILDDLTNRNDRLRQEVASLSAARARLTSGTDRSQAALAETRRRTQLLGILAGSVPAHGPGVTLTITDPKGQVGAEDLLDALEELRDAGAEAVQLEGGLAGGVAGGAPANAVRVVASTALVDESAGGIRVDGSLLLPPYRFVVVGDAAVLASAVAIPGGVVDNIRQRGGAATIRQLADVQVTALHAQARPRYARAATG